MNEGGAGSGGPTSRFCRQLRHPPMLRAMPKAWKPLPIKPSKAVAANRRALRSDASPFNASQASDRAASGGRTTGNHMAGL